MRGQIFTDNPSENIGYNAFNLSHDVKMSGQMGKLIPSLLLEVVPGDKFKISTENFARMAPMIAPVMHNIKLKTEYFFVPNRIIWKDWEDWITGKLDVVPPYLETESEVTSHPSSILNYLGIPATVGSTAFNNIKPSALPLAAYIKIFTDYYRDENLYPESITPYYDGVQSGSNLWTLEAEPFNRAWPRDYFTAALPFAQKGDPVVIPFSDDGKLNVKLDYANLSFTEQKFVDGTGTQYPAGRYIGTTTAQGRLGDVSNTYGKGFIDPNGTYYADNADASTINTLRRAFALQEFLEKDARGGTRYIEHIYEHFRVSSSDQRMQRAEYIGGMKQQMVISEVLSTAQTEVGDVVNPVGEYAGHGITVGRGNGQYYQAEEHGWIIGLVSIIPDAAYMQGIGREWTRTDQLDHFYPSFENIGEQPILMQELYAKGTAQDKDTFGYIPRYAEYKYKQNRVAGDFETNLEYWHMARKFETAPTLNADFISCVPTDRIFAVQDSEDNAQKIYMHIYHDITAIRKMQKFGTPHI